MRPNIPRCPTTPVLPSRRDIILTAVDAIRRSLGVTEVLDVEAPTIAVQIADDQGVHASIWITNEDGITELGTPPIEEHAGSALGREAHDDVRSTISVEIMDAHGPARPVGRADRYATLETTGSIVDEDEALPTVAVRHHQVYVTVVGQIARGDKETGLPMHEARYQQ